MPDRMYADEWLPSRFGLGSLRLIAYVVARGLERNRPVSGAYVNRERHQHPLEATLLSILYWIIPCIHITTLVARMSGSKAVTAGAFAASLVIVPAAWLALGLLCTPVAGAVSSLLGLRRYEVQLRVPPLALLAVSICSVVFTWPSLVIGWLWIGLVVLEAFARVICLALRGGFAALDRRLPAVMP